MIQFLQIVHLFSERFMNRNEKTKTIFSTILSFITTFIVSVIVLVAVALFALHLDGVQFFTVESGSMEPAYPVDSLVFVRETPPEQIQEGDVVTYVMNAQGTLVTHRVVRVDTQEETFITKGDANTSQDPNPVLWGNVVGKVIFSLPKFGAVFRVITSARARPYLIACVIVLGVISVAGDLLDKRRRKKQAADSANQNAGEPSKQ